MKIAIDVRSLMEGGVTGIERYTAEIIRAMVYTEPSHEYHLFYNSARKVRLPDFGDAVAVHAFRYPNKIFKMTQRVLKVPQWDRWLPQVDCVFMPSLGLMPLSADVPLVSVFHDLSFEHFPELFNFEKRLWHWVMRPRHLAGRSNAIIAVSEHTKQDVVNLYGIPEEKVHVVYSGVTAPTPLRPSGFAGQAPYILYLGTLEPRKNVDSLVQAYSAIADSVEQDLVIAGPKGWSTGKLTKAIAQSDHRQRIHVLGFVPEDEKTALYAAADLFVYPSLYEGFGFPPLEALACGTPVITSFNSAFPEVVGQWATLIDPYNVAELALVMREMLTTKPIVSKEIQEEIRQKYSWERAARETLGVLAGVV